MKAISTHTFKYTLKDIHKNTQNRKFCFVLGAGASVKSGIPTGGQLAEQWFKEIIERSEEAEFNLWISDQKIDEKDLASSYGSIYRKRFENDKTSGYEFLVKAMKSAAPSFGHIVLAQILSRTSGHCVVTTNFDSLVESSVYQFTNKTPLVCGHESLSGYARPSQTHPLIIKIHRDLLLEPKSDPAEIDKLDIGWKAPLDHIFSTHIPIIIGYGGNDGSLMDYFEKMNKPTNFFWCNLDKDYKSKKVEALIEKHDGNFVQITGFDELMHELLLVFDEIKPINEELNEITNDRISIAKKQLEEIIAAKNSDVPTALSKFEDKKKELSALEYKNLADGEPDFEKRKNIYLEALNKYPTTNWLWWAYTHFLHTIKKEYEELNELYKKTLVFNEYNAGVLNNYAIYLLDIKKDYDKAEEYYLKALSADPNNSIYNCNYANFLTGVTKDHNKAEEYYLRALASDPNHADTNGNYANFLKDKKGDYNKAEEYYLRALAADSNHTIHISNYANFLKNIKKDYSKAEKYYLKALTANPNHANSNGNYAQLLLSVGRKDKAENYILKAFDNLGTNDLLIELWFYRYAHFRQFLLEAENKIEELLSEGVRSLHWNFNDNIEEAIKDNHPNQEKLKEFAIRISSK